MWCNRGVTALPAALRSACNSVNYRPHSVILFYVGSLNCFKLVVYRHLLLPPSSALFAPALLFASTRSLFLWLVFFLLFVFHPPICLPPLCSPSLFVWTVLFGLQSEMNKKTTLWAVSSSRRSLWISFTRTAFCLTFNFLTLPRTSSFVVSLTLSRLTLSVQPSLSALFLLHLPQSWSCFSDW